MGKKKIKNYKGDKMINKMFFMLVVMFGCFTSLTAEKIYIDADEFETSVDGEAFYIHTGNNVWLMTNTVHMDKSGLFTYDYTLTRSLSANKDPQYEKKWKCPYCYQYWPIGKPCGNKDCASRYK